ncbi:hypothetical protein MCOR31_010902 [Pyricularia oryzae]|nr:hypothetical protein MCOR32_010793 [Pyricularia oryzae]KAI6356359.1 hypothetical protein MCOR31_010902 [Pyricularia oryzae]KAI6394405.1 hypothetical protein MCOR24_009531 [Pyricularia oryzae]KAI6395195.1 hypothetical protein MCOR20_010311 [Pyricularia oryzae]KAI6424792.1 hypothetical protein MCOR22_011143 [Pyricularia oryzae]
MFSSPEPIFRTTSPQLNIQLDTGDKHSFSPGDTIIGRVVRQAPIVAPHGSIRLSLHGRSLVRVDESSGGKDKTYTGEVRLLQGGRHTRVLFEGPLHVAEGPGGVAQSWAFAVDVPTHVELERADLGLGGNQHSFVPVPPDCTTGRYALPQTFSRTGGRSSARIEYYLEAVLQYRTHGGSSGRTVAATLPVGIRTPNHAPPIADLRPVKRRRLAFVQSFRLLPGMDGPSARLSLLQRAQSAVGSRRVPMLWGQWELTSPTVVQPGNPTPLPICVRFIPDARRSSPAVRGSPAPTIRLLSLVLRVQSLAVVQCRGGWADGAPRRQTCARARECASIWPPRGAGLPGRHLLGRKEWRAVCERQAPVYVPCADEWPALEVGAEAGFSLGGGGQGAGRLLLPLLTPTFATFNVRQHYRFEYEIEALVAGEEVKIPISEVVTVLPPSEDGPGGAPQVATPGDAQGEWTPSPLEGRSESWIRPPCESGAPPSFDEAVSGAGGQQTASVGGPGSNC